MARLRGPRLLRRALLVAVATLAPLVVSACGATHRATPRSPAAALPTTTISFPSGIPTAMTQILLESGQGNAIISVDLPKGTYDFQARCTAQVPLAITNVVTFSPCPPAGGNTFAAEVDLTTLDIRTTTSWTLYVGRPA